MFIKRINYPVKTILFHQIHTTIISMISDKKSQTKITFNKLVEKNFIDPFVNVHSNEWYIPLPQRRPLFLQARGWLATSVLPAVAVWCHQQWCSEILEGLAKAFLLELFTQNYNLLQDLESVQIHVLVICQSELMHLLPRCYLL